MTSAQYFGSSSTNFAVKEKKQPCYWYFNDWISHPSPFNWASTVNLSEPHPLPTIFFISVSHLYNHQHIKNFSSSITEVFTSMWRCEIDSISKYANSPTEFITKYFTVQLLPWKLDLPIYMPRWIGLKIRSIYYTFVSKHFHIRWKTYLINL